MNTEKETEDKEKLTDTDVDYIISLKRRGFAVILWSPRELGGVSPSKVEGLSIEFGHELIQSMQIAVVKY
jgi:hypothetical protein